MKTTTLGIAIGTAIAALGLAITAVPEAKAGGVYWNNNGGGGVVVNRGTTYGPRGYYNYGPNYYGGRGVVAGPNGTCARDYYLRSRWMRPLLIYRSIANQSISPRQHWRVFLFAKKALISLDNPPAN